MGNPNIEDFAKPTSIDTGTRIPCYDDEDNGREAYIAGADILTAAGLTASAAEVNQYALTYTIADITAGDSYYVVAPHAGDIAKIYTVIDDAITGDAGFSFEIATVAVTDGGITITASGSAVGDVDSSTPSAANTVTAGQAIEIINDGNASAGGRVTITFLITR